MTVPVALAIVGLAECTAARREPERAAQFYGAADTVSESIGTSFHPLHVNVSLHERYLNLAREHLDEDTFAAAFEWGREMAVTRAVEYALAPQDSTTEAEAPAQKGVSIVPEDSLLVPDTGEMLSPREVEVLWLLIAGATNPRSPIHWSSARTRSSTTLQASYRSWVYDRPLRRPYAAVILASLPCRCDSPQFRPAEPRPGGGYGPQTAKPSSTVLFVSCVWPLPSAFIMTMSWSPSR